MSCFTHLTFIPNSFLNIFWLNAITDILKSMSSNNLMSFPHQERNLTLFKLCMSMKVVKSFQPSVLQNKTNGWLLYETQHWTEMGSCQVWYPPNL